MQKTIFLLLATCLPAIAVAPCSGADKTSFDIRGIKGLWWDGIEKYQKALPWLAEHNMNFLMICYTSFKASGSDWRSDYSEEEKQQLKQLALDAEEHHIILCLSFNPGIWSKPPLTYCNERDFQLALKKVKIAHGLGINSISLCLDDINRELTPEDKRRFGNLQNAQVYFVNRLWREMKGISQDMQLIFCPSAYTTDDIKKNLDYIKTIGNEIDLGVDFFWTGPSCCSASITANDAREVSLLIKRKVIIWDNYPVNDMFPWRPLLSPFRGRSTNLPSAVKGIVSNPMKQWYISTIPLATLADYANDSKNYDPDQSIQKVVRSFPKEQQSAISLLIKLYGYGFWGSENWPPKPDLSNAQSAQMQLGEYEELGKLLSQDAGLRDIWNDVQSTLQADIASLKRMARDRKKESPLLAMGADFEGGGGDILGFTYRDRPVNLVYAKPTGKSSMQTELYLQKNPLKDVTLRICALSADCSNRSQIKLTMNDKVIFQGKADWSNSDFQNRELNVPASVLHAGENVLTISCEEESGSYGMPPWFMVAEAELAASE